MVKTYSINNLSKEVRDAYSMCLSIANTHYENFPVASFLLPRHLRRSVAAIYAFARTADDIADEGDMCRETRLELMTKFESNLYDIQYGKPPTDAVFIALKHTIECFNLPIQLFYDLLTAFRQDVLKNRYHNFTEVKDYCHYSANPIGRLLLYLSGQATRENLILSDHVCTGLQLINFVQDISIDLNEKNRCYIPLNELESYGVSIEDIKQRKGGQAYKMLLKKQIERANEIYKSGWALGQNLPGFFGLEIRFIIACGQRILDKLDTRHNLWQRPIINKFDLALAFSKTLMNRQPPLSGIMPITEKL